MNNVPTWKKVVAFIVDLIGSFLIFGYIIALLTGNTTESGFQLRGASAFILFAVVIAYFVLMNKYAGGTVGKRLLGIAHKK